MNSLSTKPFSMAITAVFNNGERLLQDSMYLLEYERFPGALALSILAQEEFAKAFLLVLVDDGAIPWNKEVLRALRDHTCKQLAAAIMIYLYSEWEKWLNHPPNTKLPSTEFPPHIADALNIIRHEKIPKSGKWSWDDETTCDHVARAIANGELDKKKQNALYISLTEAGKVNGSPSDVTKQEAEAEYEKTVRIKETFHGFGANAEFFKTVTYSKVSDAFKLLFGTLTVEDYNSRW